MSASVLQSLHPRWSVFATVIPKARPQWQWTALNLSEGGMFVAGAPLLKHGVELDVELVLPGSNGPALELHPRVQVMWSRLPGASTLMKPAGMGVRFVGMSPAERVELRAYVQDLATHQVTPVGMPQVADEASLPEIDIVEVTASRDESAENDDISASYGLSSGGSARLGTPGSQRRDTVRTPAKSYAIVPALTPSPARAPVGQVSMALPVAPARAPGPPAAAAPARAAASVVGPAAKTPAPVVELQVGGELAAGTRLGSYEIRGLLGSGGMGDVYLAEHSLLGRRVALKRMHSRFVSDKAAVRRFFDEGRLVNRVAHEHIVEITDFVCTDTEAYYVMELLVGRTLKDAAMSEGPLPLARVVHIAKQLATALSAVHEAGIIHRDLKPSNIILIERGGMRDFVKLVDFGIAKLREPEGVDDRTQAGLAVGTPGFMAPEQFLGEEIDGRSDVYALGVLLFLMVTNRLPWEARTATEMMLKQATQPPPPPSVLAKIPIPDAFEDLVLRCLARDRTQRPQTMQEVYIALDRMPA